MGIDFRQSVVRECDANASCVSRYVLANHQLFLLAEQPPSDMAGLLGLFQHVPAIIRRRAKELLDTIREASKEVAVLRETVVADAAIPDEVQDVPMSTVNDAKESLADAAETVHTAHLWPSGEYLLLSVDVNALD